MERKRKVTAGLYDAFKFYKNKAGRNKVDVVLYSKVCQEFNKRISDKIIRKSFEFKLPYRLGFLRIKAIKQKVVIKDGKIDTARMPIDWPSTRKYWEELYPDKTWEEIKKIPNKKLIIHTNEHTDGYLLKWYWDRRQSNVKNQTAYVFRAVKGGKSEDGYYYGRRGLSKWASSYERDNYYYE
jgi:hypothetical protein